MEDGGVSLKLKSGKLLDFTGKAQATRVVALMQGNGIKGEVSKSSSIPLCFIAATLAVHFANDQFYREAA
jgi:hypothetical protein